MPGISPPPSTKRGSSPTGSGIVSELTPLRETCEAPQAPLAVRAAVLSGLCATYVLCIIPVGIVSSLLPALEEDHGFGWTPTTSGQYMFWATWAVASGSLTIGWLPDYFPNVLVMLFFVFVSGVFLHAMSLARTPATFIGLHMVVFVLKSLTWPAAMSIIGTHLSGMKPEFAILLVGIASRISSVGSSVLMGSLMIHMSWRTAMQIIGGLLMCGAIIFRLLIRLTKMDYLLETPALQQARHESADLAPEAGDETREQQQRGRSFTDLLAYFGGLLKDRTFLLLIFFASGLELCIGLSTLFSAFLHSIYRQGIADSAIHSGSMNIGEVISLLLGLSLVALGVSRKHIFSLIQLQAAVGVLVAAAILLFRVSYSAFFTLGLVLGFCTTLGGYLVVPLHIIELAKARSMFDIAARVTIADGLATVVGATTRLLVGIQRNENEHQGLALAAMFSLFGTSTMFVSLFLLVRMAPEVSAGSAPLHAD